MMNSIVASYTSCSDSDEEIQSEQDSLSSVDRAQPNQFENKRNSRAETVQNMKKPSNQVIDKVRLPVSHNKCLSVRTKPLVQSHITSVLSTSNTNNKRTTDTETQDVNNSLYSKGPTNPGIKPGQKNSNYKTTLPGATSSEDCLKKDIVMPYIPKSKRAKLHATETEQESTDRITSNDSSNSLSSAFKNAKLFSRKNISRCNAPKRRVTHFDAHQGCINRISWNPCFQDILLSASMDCSVKIWNVQTTPSCVLQVSGHTQAVKDVKWNIDGLKILIGGYDKFSRINDVNTGKIFIILPFIVKKEVLKQAFSHLKVTVQYHTL